MFPAFLPYCPDCFLWVHSQFLCSQLAYCTAFSRTLAVFSSNYRRLELCRSIRFKYPPQRSQTLRSHLLPQPLLVVGLEASLQVVSVVFVAVVMFVHSYKLTPLVCFFTLPPLVICTISQLVITHVHCTQTAWRLEHDSLSTSLPHARSRYWNWKLTKCPEHRRTLKKTFHGAVETL
jgi:hypothetical protein